MPYYAVPLPCCGLEKSLAKRHGRSTAGARHGMCESNTVALLFKWVKVFHYRPDRPLGIPEVKAPEFFRLSAL